MKALHETILLACFSDLFLRKFAQVLSHSAFFVYNIVWNAFLPEGNHASYL